jgi:hypothetical protein
LPGGFALLAIVLALTAPETMSAQPDTDRSLNADKPPVTEAGANVTPTVVAPDLSSLSREQLEARIKTLEENLASANAESESFRQQWQDLKLRDEALGVEALTADQRKLEDKVVQAVAELYQSEMRRREALQLLQKLIDTTNALLQTAPNYDAKVRGEYEIASRSAKDYLAGHGGTMIPIGQSISDGKIADVNPALNAVVLNIGKSQGVKEGMPFRIERSDAEIGTVKVVLARELVSLALVESVKKDVVLKVGDLAMVDAH